MTQLIGVVHLLPLPGSPRARADLSAVVARAAADATALVEGGCDGVIVENFGDAPFAKGRVDAFTVAAMTRAVDAVRSITAGRARLGVNVLRNDALSALAIAAAVGADFVRVNVLSGAMVTDQGVIEGDAHTVLRERARLAPNVQIAADVHVKHAVPLAPTPITDSALDLAERALADAIIVTGRGTGRPADLDDVRAVRGAVAKTGIPVWVGSGVTEATADALVGLADAAIVGTALHQDGQISLPVDVRRVAALRRVLGSGGR